MISLADACADEELRRLVGLEALARELGPVGMVRFLQQFEIGRGDYSVERHLWLEELDVQTLAEKIHQRREET
ncbi:MAG: hypothetical protein WBW48_08005 [Anaerolineae bacterium]